MKQSNSVAAQIQRNNLVVSGVKAHAKELAPTAVPLADSLAKRQPVIEKLNADQEAARTALKAATAALTKECKTAAAERQKIIRLAEAAFGPRSPEITQFRSKVDGQV